MPHEEQWIQYFNPEDILKQLGVDHTIGNVVDFGSGYGTFSIPAARKINGTLYAIDVELQMVQALQRKAMTQNLNNLRAILRDFVSEGSGLGESTVDYVMLFNILHLENPTSLLREACRILKPNRKVGIIHWNYDPSTPRGPPMNIRPKPEQVRRWAESVGFIFERQLDLRPYHYGMVLRK